jgi:hypothetical protein
MRENMDSPMMNEESAPPPVGAGAEDAESHRAPENLGAQGVEGEAPQAATEVPEGSAPTGGEGAEEPGGSDLESAAEAGPPREPSRISRFLRAALRWITAFALVFTLGVLATWFARVRPQAQAMNELQVERDSALARAQEIDSRLAGLEAENGQLQDRVDALEEQLGEQEAARTQAQSHLDLLQVLVDVNSAQLAMAQDDPSEAKAALAATGDRLTALEKGIDGAQAAQFQDLRKRLGLVMESIGEDDFAAQRDLEVMASKVLTLEESLFGE